MLRISGTIGDTVGGLSSFFLGALSIYLIYHTYQDQRSSNLSQNLTFHLNEHKNNLIAIKNDWEKFYQSISKGSQNRQFKIESCMGPYEITPDFDNLLQKIIEHSAQNLFFANNIRFSNLNKEHRIMIRKQLSTNLLMYYQNFSGLFQKIQDYIRGYPLNNDIDESSWKNGHINTLCSYLLRYQEDRRALTNNGDIVMKKLIPGTFEDLTLKINRDIYDKIDFEEYNILKPEIK